MRFTQLISCCGLCLALFWSPTTIVANSLPEGVTDSPLLNSRFLLFGSKKLRRAALKWVVQRNNTDMVAPLIYGLRFLEPNQRPAIARALRKLTGKRFGDNWFRWVEWQQQQPDIKPFDGFDVFLTALFTGLDPGFSDFIAPGMAHSIRLEEIVWGGAAAGTGIPALTNPRMLPAAQAKYLSPNEPVFGVAINGDVRAYPYRFMDWHEMLNDVVGGVPVALAYCTLCGSGILFDARVPAASRGAMAEKLSQPLQFGSSGLLYRSNKLMFDTATNSLWNQFTGKPVTGELTDSQLALTTLPLVTTTWREWQKLHPDTQVLDINTGFKRDYSPGKPYGDYFNSPDLIFPAAQGENDPAPKSEVFVLRIAGAEKSWPLPLFKGGAVINDRVGALQLVLIGDAKTKTVRAYRSEGRRFEESSVEGTIDHEREQWQITEAALLGPREGEREREGENAVALTRLPGHLAYSFAWQNYFGTNSASGSQQNKKSPATER